MDPEDFEWPPAHCHISPVSELATFRGLVLGLFSPFCVMGFRAHYQIAGAVDEPRHLVDPLCSVLPPDRGENTRWGPCLQEARKLPVFIEKTKHIPRSHLGKKTM